jgi:hypothetical protein
MGKLSYGRGSSNVNVTLDPREAFPELKDKEFACPLCGAGLPILFSKRNKPYCTCNSCGIQLFFRGKHGIVRLKAMAAEGILVSVKEQSAAHAISLLNRLNLLELQKKELNVKVGIIFKDPNVENAIQAVDAEIERVQGELAQIARTNQKEADK